MPAFPHQKKTWRNIVMSWRLYVLILPALIYVFIFSYIPMYGIQLAFKNYRTNLGIWGSPWVGLKHFIRFVQFPNFWKIIRNTLSLSLYSLLTFPCSVIFALLINELNHRTFKRIVQMVSYAPYFISTVVICSMLTLFLNRETGVLTDLFVLFGMQRTDLLTNSSAFPSIYVWSGVWQGLGWSTIIYLSALSSVSQEMIEAATIDGANHIQIITHINIPVIMPTIVIMLILSCCCILSVGFEKVFLLQNPLNLDRSQIISTYVYEVGIAGGQFSYSAAIGLFNTVVNLVLISLVNQIARRFSGISIW